MQTRSILGASLGLLGLTACATAPDPAPAGSVPDLRVPVAAGGTDVPRPEPPQDYSPQGLFGESHGNFLNSMQRYRPQVRATFSALVNTGIANQTGDFDVRRYDLAGRVPLVIDPDSVLLAGGHAGFQEYDFSSGYGGIQDEDLTQLTLDIGYGRFFTDDTYAYAVFSPGIFSDLDETTTHRDWEFHGEGMVVFRYNDQVYLKGGVRVSDDFEDTDAFPVAGVSWLVTPEWRFDLLAPLQAEVSYSPNASTIVHGGLELQGNQYRVHSSNPSGQAYDWNTQELDLYLGLIQRFNDNLSAFGRIGAAVAGHYDLRGPGGARVDGQLESTLMFELGVGWDF